MIEVIVLIALVGLLVWAVTSLVPMPPQFKNAIYVLAVVFLSFYVLSILGLLPHGFRHLKL